MSSPDPSETTRPTSWLPLLLAIVVLIFSLALAARAYFVSGALEPKNADSVKDVQSLTARALQTTDVDLLRDLACTELPNTNLQAFEDFFVDAEQVAESEEALLGFEVRGEEAVTEGETARFDVNFEGIAPLDAIQGTLSGSTDVVEGRHCLTAISLQVSGSQPNA